jgi:hypothetical protein
MTSSPSTFDSLDTDQLKTVLGLATARVKDLADALERNWTAQLVCAGVGIALVYDVAELPRIICKYFAQEACSLRSTSVIFMLVVLYYLMRLGVLLTAFLEARQIHDRILAAYLGKNYEKNAFRPVGGEFVNLARIALPCRLSCAQSRE